MELALVGRDAFQHERRRGVVLSFDGISGSGPGSFGINAGIELVDRVMHARCTSVDEASCAAGGVEQQLLVWSSGAKIAIHCVSSLAFASRTSDSPEFWRGLPKYWYRGKGFCDVVRVRFEHALCLLLFRSTPGKLLGAPGLHCVHEIVLSSTSMYFLAHGVECFDGQVCFAQ